MTEDFNFIRSILAEAMTPKESLFIDEWIDRYPLMLPTNTAEPGRYSLERTPYQRDVLRAMSPEHPAKTVVLEWGSQTGKTTTENATMAFYMAKAPAPMIFAFSDDKNLNLYVKNKFNPLLSANPDLKAILKTDGKTSGDTNSLKVFPGGFLKFLSGRSESSMRSDSAKIAIADEVDGMEVTKGGDLKALLMKRLNTFRETSKLILSSTPSNESTIHGYLQESTFNKFFIPCKHCGGLFTFEQDHLRWKLVDDTHIVTDAWMECPHCHGRLNNEDKVDLLPKGQWLPTNPKADTTYVGYKLPSFYAPVGWLSWKDIAQEWVDAYAASDEKREERMTAYFNTILAEPYTPGSTTQEWRAFFDKNKDSEYVRGQIPSWVNLLTTGADVQGNRIEVSLYGWGALGRSLAIDHWSLYTNEVELDTQGSAIWSDYFDSTLNAVFEREDGLKMRTVANAMDASYKTNACYAFWRLLPPEHKERMYLFRGRDTQSGYRPNLQHAKVGQGNNQVEWYQVPVSNLKRAVFQHLNDSLKDPEGEVPAFYMEFPRDYDQEYYQQLFSEAWVKEKGKWGWSKLRDRNEILDVTVYNLCLLYAIGAGDWSRAQWERMAQRQREQLNGSSAPTKRKPGRRMLSKGVEV